MENLSKPFADWTQGQDAMNAGVRRSKVQESGSILRIATKGKGQRRKHCLRFLLCPVCEFIRYLER
jgi:hypothetical protein